MAQKAKSEVPKVQSPDAKAKAAFFQEIDLITSAVRCERNPKRRNILEYARIIKFERAIRRYVPNAGYDPRLRQVARFLIFRSTPKQLRTIASALELKEYWPDDDVVRMRKAFREACDAARQHGRLPLFREIWRKYKEIGGNQREQSSLRRSLRRIGFEYQPGNRGRPPRKTNRNRVERGIY